MEALIGWMQRLPGRWARTSGLVGALAALAPHAFARALAPDRLLAVGSEVAIAAAGFALCGYALGRATLWTVPSPATDAGAGLERRVVAAWAVGGATLAALLFAVRVIFGWTPDWPMTPLLLGWLTVGAASGMLAGQICRLGLRILRITATGAAPSI